MDGPNPPHWSRHFDPWYWYTEVLPPGMSFFLPILLAPIPIVVAAIFETNLVGPVVQVIGATLVNPNAAIAYGFVIGLRPALALAIVLWIQLLLLVWVVRNVELLRRWKRFDRFLQKPEKRAQELYDRHHWLRKFHFAGMVVSVFLPFGTGILTGVFLGKLTGMSDRRLVTAIYVGTVLWLALLSGLGRALEGWVRSLF